MKVRVGREQAESGERQTASRRGGQSAFILQAADAAGRNDHVVHPDVARG
jgi:hypothetical protein